jgi:outer membrane protein OmpA-like peptidoglycan-associated protein
MKSKFTVLFLSLFTFTCFGQWEVGGFLGSSNYQGDVVKPILFTLKETTGAGGLLLRYHINEQMAVRGNLLIGKISGADDNFDSRGNRGLSFSSPLTEISLVGEYEIFGGRRLRDGMFRKYVSPYFFGGIGVGLINPTTNFNEDVNKDPSMVANIAKDKAHGFKKANLVIPLGAGFKFGLTPRVTLGAEMGLRPAFTDYLDGISEAANPEKDDWYVFGGLTLGYRLGKMSNMGDGRTTTKSKDSDGDGIDDLVDKCPTSPGNAATNGCPAITMADKETLKLAMKNVNFETAKTTLLPASNATLDQIVSLMQKYPDYSLNINGHTDAQGEEGANLSLSQGRAQSCYDYLVSKGIGAARLTAKGYGESTPIASNDTEEGRKQNRRVEFDLLVK